MRTGTAELPGGLDEVVRRHRRGLLSLALSRLARIEDAEDVVQAALLGYMARGRADRVEDAGAYLRTSVLNLCRNRRRDRRPTVDLPGETPSPAEPPGRAAARRELSGLLRDGIRALPEAYRAAVWLVHVEGMTPAEVADATGANPLTVKSALARGRRILRERLGPVLRKAGYLAV